MTKDEARIGNVFSDRSDLQLRLLLTVQPSINVIRHVMTEQMTAPGKLTARHTNGGGGLNRGGNRDSGRRRVRKRERSRVMGRVIKIRRWSAKQSHKTGTGARVLRRGTRNGL